MSAEKYTVEQVRAALEASGGIKLGAAHVLKCSPTTIRKMIDTHPELQNAERDIKNSNLDIAETALLTLVRDKNLGAVCFYLKCMGKDRGWVERAEVTGTNGAAVNITIAGRDADL